MKIMLLTAATGGGPPAAAAAVEKYIRDNTSYDVVTVDALKAVGRFLDKPVCDAYRFRPSAWPPCSAGCIGKPTAKTCSPIWSQA